MHVTTPELRVLHGYFAVFSDVSGYLMVSVKSSCRDIVCEPVPGSPPPFLFNFCWAKGEPGNEAIYLHDAVKV